MELRELLQTRPADYLQSGLRGADGQALEGLSGTLSLAMACRCHEDGVEPETPLGAAEFLTQAVEAGPELDAEDLAQPLEADAWSAFDALCEADDVTSAAALRELFEAARPWLQCTADVLALAGHLQRIGNQLTLLRAMEQGAAELESEN
jgi:hypothetical protein